MLTRLSGTLRRSAFNIKYKKHFVGQDFHPSFRCDNYKNFTFGSRCYIGPFCHFDALGGIEIEDFTIIAPHVKIWSYNHDFKSRETPYGGDNLLKPVRIGRGCWIGLGSIILPGAKIGEGSVVGAGCIVSGDIPPYHLVRPSYSEARPITADKTPGMFYRDKKNRC